MIATYAAALAVCAASLPIGQAAVALCGVRRWSWLAPAVGMALLVAVAWGAVRLPGGGTLAAALLATLALGSIAFLRGRVEGGRAALRAGLPVGLGALAAASLPFAVEGHFGILGTGFNPDMSQHLLAAERLAAGAEGQLLREGYPLGPHALAVALREGLGIGLVPAFSGLTVAVAVLAPLTALAAFARRPPLHRTAAALLVGLTYLVASYFAQGAFKETMQALLVLAFVLALRETHRIDWRAQPRRFVPAALLAAGAVYVYSFPGLLWLAAVMVPWIILRRLSAGGVGEGGVEDDPARSAPPSPATGPAAASAASLAVLVLAAATLPELGRMLDFRQFETFDPFGSGLGNLFGQISPLTALGIWPSGDFRLAPGDGAAPAAAFYLGAAFAAALLLAGLHRAVRRRESALLAGVAAVAAVYLAARLGGTPYTAAKALAIAAPLLALAILLSLRLALAAPYLLLAGACSLLALANAPVGPASYSPALTSLRPLLGGGPTLVLAPESLLEERHGARYLAWELRGGRVCIQPRATAGGAAPPGIRFVIVPGAPGAPPFAGLDLRRRAGPYLLWERRGVRGGPSPCPLIAERQARRGP